MPAALVIRLVVSAARPSTRNSSIVTRIRRARVSPCLPRRPGSRRFSPEAAEAGESPSGCDGGESISEARIALHVARFAANGSLHHSKSCFFCAEFADVWRDRRIVPRRFLRCPNRERAAPKTAGKEPFACGGKRALRRSPLDRSALLSNDVTRSSHQPGRVPAGHTELTRR